MLAIAPTMKRLSRKLSFLIKLETNKTFNGESKVIIPKRAVVQLLSHV